MTTTVKNLGFIPNTMQPVKEEFMDRKRSNSKTRMESLPERPK